MMDCWRCGQPARGRHNGSAVCDRTFLANKLRFKGLRPIEYNTQVTDPHSRFLSTSTAARQALELLGHEAQTHKTHFNGRAETWTTPEGLALISRLNVIKAASKLALPRLAKLVRRRPDVLDAVDATYRLTGDLDQVAAIVKEAHADLRRNSVRGRREARPGGEPVAARADRAHQA